MIFYLLYLMGYFIANNVSVRTGYRIACFIADTHFLISTRDRRAIINNLKTVFCDKTDRENTAIARQVFRNFAKYLVDFFRFSRIDQRFIRDRVKIVGIENMKSALAKGKGVILLSAHIGNWELGGIMVAKIGFPVSAVVMSHQNKKVNDFFTRQRAVGPLKPIFIGPSLRKCFTVLKKKEALALLGDRDFSTSGMKVKFFNKEPYLPHGPASISQATGSAIVPCFMIRMPDDSFTLSFGKPLYPQSKKRDPDSIRNVIESYIASIEEYIKKYPSQWYMFREVWNNCDRKTLRPDTII